jgi:hypothetical protein
MLNSDIKKLNRNNLFLRILMRKIQFWFLFSMMMFFSKSYAEERCELVFNDFKTPWVWKSADGLLLGLRSNVHHFWEWSFKNKELLSSELIGFQGWLLGDAHLFNFAEIKLKGGGYKWSFNDLDDSGVGPFILDFIRFATTVKASNFITIDSKALYDAYVDGLVGNDYKKPNIVKKVQSLSKNGIIKFQKKFIKQMINLDTETVKTGMKNIVSFDEGPVAMQNFVTKNIKGFESVLPDGAKITDVTFRTKPSGGSQGLVRIFLSVKVEKEFLIYEFKPLVRAGLDYYQSQISQKYRINTIMDLLWKDVSPVDYGYVQIGGYDFFMRIRSPKVFEIHDEDQFLAMSVEDQKNYLLYIANWIGKKHREQLNSSESYGKELQKPESFELIEKFGNQYLTQTEKLNAK